MLFLFPFTPVFPQKTQNLAQTWPEIPQIKRVYENDFINP